MYKSILVIKIKNNFLNTKGLIIIHTTKFTSYFNNLDIKPTKLSLDLVAEIQQKHLATFSFNNIAVLLNKPISLKIDDILEKIVTKKLGGYCFEHNKLIHDVLLSIGFDVRISIARVFNNGKDDTPRTHRVTILTFKGKEYLVDVGFGAMTPSIPLKLSSKNKITNDYKITQDKDNNFTLELSKKKNFIKLYKFNLETYTEADCKIGNFYSESHPDATFLNNFVVSRKLKNKTLSYRNNSYHQISNTFTNILNIIDPIQMQNILKKDFGISISKKESKLLFKKAEEFRIA